MVGQVEACLLVPIVEHLNKQLYFLNFVLVFAVELGHHFVAHFLSGWDVEFEVVLPSLSHLRELFLAELGCK